MRTWHIIAICFSIILSTLGATFYLKYEPKSQLNTNYGPVRLGNVFAEKVMFDLVLIDNDQGGLTEKLVDSGSYYDMSQSTDKAFTKYFDKLNLERSDKDKLSYDHATPLTKNLKIKINTYINFYSSNFQTIPFTFNIKEETYPLPQNVLIKKSINEILNKHISDTQKEISDTLFITDKENYNVSPIAEVDDKKQTQP
ncbi:hypothetical protein [Acinetobacter baumannii]|uniref:hypothetical protein n=1 Tax=Acinetobacter baumannii TaxID=470 RepID=UPI0020BE7D87|nr:hypothetical protein [Acinetobacter baumannii]MCF4954816.1 hypothetical protein [Acinetobacter baumannii]MCL6174858.1 hypothetical protein [Acinetobacter baumannii]MCL6180204.1 hypothetical protein [Acinetobacter baumannii]MCL6188026.1 hypothetical protein [Acinetobacter baumannii]MCL6207735.1 hypothetical protein [Acinetobacter baumannii]